MYEMQMHDPYLEEVEEITTNHRDELQGSRTIINPNATTYKTLSTIQLNAITGNRFCLIRK